MTLHRSFGAILIACLLCHTESMAGPATSAVRAVAQPAVGPSGPMIARYGEAAAPFLRHAGAQGGAVLEQAGDKAPEIVRLYARRGDDAIWIVSQPNKLAIFLRHGDSAADALIRHPGIADELIERFGVDAAAALNAVSRRGAQLLAIVADEGLLTVNPRGQELLSVVRRYGDDAMTFIWENKGALAVAAVLAAFLADPAMYLTGAAKLVVAPVVSQVDWTWPLTVILLVACLPLMIGALGLGRGLCGRFGWFRNLAKPRRGR